MTSDKVYEDLVKAVEGLEMNPETRLFLHGYYEGLATYKIITEKQWQDLSERNNADPKLLEKINY